MDLVPLGVIRGRVAVQGWALSPYGVDHVNVCFGNRKICTRAAMHPRPDVTRMLPGYPAQERVGFATDLSGPPAGIRGETDMQVEIVDGRGRKTLLRPSFFRWYPRPRVPCVWDEGKLDALLQRIGGEAPHHRQRLLEGSESIRDVAEALIRDADLMTDLQFTEHAVGTLMGRADVRLTSRSLDLLTHGSPRERVLDAIVTSREFAAEHLRAGAVTVGD